MWVKILSTISDVIVIVVGFLIYNYIKEFPIFHNNKKLQANEHVNQRQLQQEAFYREVSGEKLEELLREWSGYIVDLTTISSMDTDKVRELTHQVFMYGSKQTIEMYSKYTQFTYNSEKYEKKYPDQYQLLSLMIFTSIVTNLKYDFTGYFIDPATFLRIKLTDFSDQFSDKDLEKVRKIISEIPVG